MAPRPPPPDTRTMQQHSSIQTARVPAGAIRRIQCTAATREQPQHSRSRHATPAWRWRQTLALCVAACSALCLGVPSVSAQSSGLTQLGPSLPDFTRGHALFTLLFFALTWPVFLVSLVALWKQRGFYPLAGRGAGFLFLTNLCVAAASLVLTAITLSYSESGPPCGLEFLAASISVLPLSCCYMLRGFILIWRLEISNFLAEIKSRDHTSNTDQQFGASTGGITNMDDDAAEALTRQNTRLNATAISGTGAKQGGLMLMAPGRDRDSKGGGADCSSSPLSSGCIDSPGTAAADETQLMVPGSVQLVSYPVAPSTVTASAARSTVLGRAVSQSNAVSRREGVEGLRRFHASDGSVGSSAGTSPAVAPAPAAMSKRDSIEIIALGEGLVPPTLASAKDGSARTSLARQSSNAASVTTSEHTKARGAGNAFLLDSASTPISLANTPAMGPLVSPVQPPPAVFTRPANHNTAAIQPIEEEASMHGRISGTSTRAPSGHKSSSSGSDALDLASIPGEWYLRHAHWIDPHNLCAVVSLFVGTIIGGGLAISLAGASDPDVQATNDEMVLLGERPEWAPPLYHRAQLHPQELFHAAPCMLSSSKMLYLQCLIVGVIIPMVAWIVWKLKQNMQRAQQRKRTSLAGRSSAEDSQGGEPGAGLTLVSSLASIRGRYASSDTDAVKHELQLIGLVALALTLGYPLLTKFATRFIMFDVLGPLVAIEVISILTPLYVGWKIAREHRAFLHEQRLKSLQSGVGAEALHKLPHHRPLYRLKYILRSPRTFPVFLRFLEKEYSQENALFLHRVRLLEKSCRILEARIPTWPKPGGEDGEAGPGGAQHTAAQWKQNHARAPTTFNGANPRRTTYQRSLPGSTNMAVAVRIHGSNRASLDREGGNMPSFDAHVIASPAAAVSEAQTAPLLHVDDMQVHDYDAAAGAGSEMEIIAPTPAPAAVARSTVAARPVSSNSPALAGHRAQTTQLSVRNGSGDFLASSGGSLHQTASTPGSLNGSMKLGHQRKATGAHHHARQSTGNSLTPGGQRAGSNHQSGAAHGGSTDPATLSKSFSPAELQTFHRSSQDVLAECRAIFETFLAPTAATPLNLDADLASLIAHQLQMLESWVPTSLGIDGKPSADAMLSTLPAPPPFPLSTLFRQTALTIFELVNKDSFRRFILTESFLDLLIQADEAEMLRTAQESSLQATTQAVIAEAKLALCMRRGENPAWVVPSVFAMAGGEAGSAMHSIYYPRGEGTVQRSPHSIVAFGGGGGVVGGSRMEKSRQYAEGGGAGDDRDDLALEHADAHSDESPRSDLGLVTRLPPPPPPRVKVALTAAAAASIASRSPQAGTPQFGPMQTSAPSSSIHLSRSLPGSKRSSAEHPHQSRAFTHQQNPQSLFARPPSITVSPADTSTQQGAIVTTTSTAKHRSMLSSSLVVSVTSAAGETLGGSGGSHGHVHAAPLRPDRASASSSQRSRDREAMMLHAGAEGDSPPISPHLQQQPQQQHSTPSTKAVNAATSQSPHQRHRAAASTAASSPARRAQAVHLPTDSDRSADSQHPQPPSPPSAVAIFIPQ